MEKQLRVHVVSMWPSQDSPERGVFVERQVAALKELGQEVSVTPLTDVRTGRFYTPMKYAALLTKTIAGARKSKADILHGHYLVPTGAVVRIAARSTGRPYIVTAHGTDVANAERSERIRKQTEAVVRDARAVIAVSESLADRIEKLFPGVGVSVIDMGVDTTRFTPSGSSGRPEPGDPPRFVAVGNLLPNKNHSSLIKAVAKIPGARLLVIGAGPLAPTLSELIDDLGVSDRVALAGRASHEELAYWYRCATAACLVSLQEGFGLTALEAVACGTPVVVSQNAPVAEIIISARAGVGVDPTSIDSIHNALVEAGSSEPLGTDCIRAAIEGRSVVDRARDLKEIYDSIS